MLKSARVPVMQKGFLMLGAYISFPWPAMILDLSLGNSCMIVKGRFMNIANQLWVISIHIVYEHNQREFTIRILTCRKKKIIEKENRLFLRHFSFS